MQQVSKENNEQYNSCICVCTGILVRVCICIAICIYTRICICICLCICCICICISVFACVSISVSVCVILSICLYLVALFSIVHHLLIVYACSLLALMLGIMRIGIAVLCFVNLGHRLKYTVNHIRK